MTMNASPTSPTSPVITFPTISITPPPPAMVGGFTAIEFKDYERRLMTRYEAQAQTDLDAHRDNDICNDTYSDIFEDHDSISTKLAFDIEQEQGEEEEEGRTSGSNPETGRSSSQEEDLPTKRQAKYVRNVRHICWNVYRRLFTIIFVANLIAFVVVLARARNLSGISVSNLSTAAVANIFVAIAIRQDYVANALYQAAWLVPLSAPLWLRRRFAKIYEHGGVHSGCAISGTIWFIALAAAVSRDYVVNTLRSGPVLALSYTVLGMLLIIILFAWPRNRMSRHDWFEYTHRFLGWFSIGIFWALLIVFVHAQHVQSNISFSTTLVREPTFWFLVGITIHTVLPWLRLRRWRFEAEVLSPHALRLTFPKRLRFCRGIAIAEGPLHEYHAFATFPNLDGHSTSIIVSRAGDWTSRQIANPRSHYWVRGLPKTGVLSMARVFKRVVIVTTGSGIGPCLSFLSDSRHKTISRILWSAPKPRETFGEDVVRMVQDADSTAMIVDSKKEGRQDMVLLAWRLYVESESEAVFIISNPVLTKKVKYGLESRGVPAYGPVWDS